MFVETPNFALLIPEMFVAAMACIILLIDVFMGKKYQKLSYYLVQFTLVVTTILTLQFYNMPTTVTFNGMFILDHLAVVLKLVIFITSFFAFLYSHIYVREYRMPFGEYYVLGLLSVLGMMVIVSASHLLTLFLGLELFSLPIYAMVAFRRESPIATEAAVKYFVISALASGMMLYGFSMLYGATGQLYIGGIAKAIHQIYPGRELILSFGMVFVMVGIAFKLGAVPFHMWVPDVYEGAPTPVILFLGSAPKIAALGLVFRLLVQAMPDLFQQWQPILIAIAILSMALGNLAAIAQTNIKRMLAYSSIAHMGYMLLGIIAGTPSGYGAAVFYMIAYAIMTLGAFALIVMLSHAGFEADKIDDFRGLNSRNPWLAFMMLLIMFSLAGVPPIVGFMAKVAVLQALISVHLVWLAALALLFAIIGAYYYIRVVKVMYFESPVEKTPIVCTKDMRVAFTINGLLVLVLGIFPGFLFTLCESCF